MQSPGADATEEGRGNVNLNDGRLQNLPARSRYFRDVTILVWNGPRRTEVYAFDWLVAQVSGLIDGGFLRQQFLGANHVRCHDITILKVGGTPSVPMSRRVAIKSESGMSPHWSAERRRTPSGGPRIPKLGSPSSFPHFGIFTP